MTEQIHVLINGEEYGPYSDAEFRQYLAEQNIISHDLVWTEPLAQWMTVEEFLKKPKPEPTPKVPSKLPTPSDGREATDLFYRGINLSLGDNGVSEDKPAVYRCFLQAAELGNAQAQLRVAREYRWNLYSVFQPSQPLAIHWFECAAAQGEAEAAKELDEVLKERAEQREAVREFAEIAKAAYANELDAVFKLGTCYFHGQGVSRDSDKAVALFRQVAEKGHTAAQHALAMRFEYGDGVEPDLAEAAKWYRLAAEQGNTEAQSALGRPLADGKGVPRDKVEAVKWYREAASKGDETAQFNLAGCYYHGRGIPQDFQEAKTLWLALADKGNTDAQNQLGLMCLRGEGCPQDAREAARWLKKAADEYSSEAAFNFAGLLVKGRGVHRDMAEAARYYRLAAERGDKEAFGWLENLAESGLPFAQLNLGLLYVESDFDFDLLDKHPVERNDATAMKLIRAAAKGGFAEAQFQLAEIYLVGERFGGKVPENPASGMKWLRRAAEQGHPEAQAMLGLRLVPTEHNDGDHLEAHKWLSLALEQGQDVKKDFDDLVSQMEEEQIREAQELAAEFEPVVEYSADEASDSEPDVQGAGKRTCGSGFFLTANGYFATNFHVVQNAASIHISTAHESHQAKLVASDEANDLAILKLDGKFSCLAIAASDSVHLGEPVFTVGFPNPDLQGLAPKLTRGEISSLSGIRDNPSEFQISVPIQPGNSGGPLVTETGIVVGVVVARLHDSNTLEKTGSLPQNVNYAVKSDRLLELVRSVPGLEAKLLNLSPEGFPDRRTCVDSITAACAQVLCDLSG
jgi:TPR repeat protein